MSWAPIDSERPLVLNRSVIEVVHRPSHPRAAFADCLRSHVPRNPAEVLPDCIRNDPVGPSHRYQNAKIGLVVLYGAKA